MLAAICLTAFMPTPSPPADTPKVEPDFGSWGAGVWKGKRFAEILPADSMKRIVRISESGFAGHTGRQGEQAAYDALIAHLLESKEPARDCVLGGNEGTRVELVVLTKEGEVFHIEVIGMAGTPPAPGAIVVFGKSRGARIDVNGFKYPERKK